jgi:hypothetical protein
MKKALILLFTLCMVAVLFVPSATAAETVSSGTCGKNVTWTLDDTGTLTISGTGDMEDYTYNTPAPWYNQKSSITSVVIEDGITSIGSYAFSNCTAVTQITIPEGVTGIGDCAFSGCTGVTTQVTIPEGVTSLGVSAFSNCRMRKLFIPKSVTQLGKNAFYGCSYLLDVYYAGELKDWCTVSFGSLSASPKMWTVRLHMNGELISGGDIVIPEGVTSIGSNAFSNFDDITSITLPESLTSIEWNAFYGCSDLTTINIPQNVTRIGSSAFHNCKNLSAVSIPEGVTVIEYGTFFGCKRLVTVSIPKSVTEIRGNAFNECTALQNVYYAGELKDWCMISFEDSSSNPKWYANNLYMNGELISTNDWMFNDVGVPLGKLVIPEGITSIGQYTFAYFTDITGFTLPEGLTSIGDYAFYGCDRLAAIDIPDGVTYIGNNAFRNCAFLAAVNIPDSVTTIGKSAFHSCYRLETSIPDSVTAIGDSAFCNCTALTEANVPEGVKTLNGSVFYNCSSLTTLYLPKSIKSISMDVFGNCTALKDVYYAGELKDWCRISFGGSQANPMKHADNIYMNGQLIAGDIVIPEGIKSIGRYTFDSFHGMTAVTIPTGVTKIEKYAFTECDALKTVTFPEGLKIIGEYAFYECGNLKAIAVPESVETIQCDAFEGCSSLTDITLPLSLNSIELNAFNRCTGIRLVHYTGSEQLMVNIGNFNDSLKNAPWHCNVAVDTVDGRTRYYCAQCDLYYYADELPSVIAQPTLTGTGFTLSFEDEILVNFYYTAENTADVTEQGMLVFYADPGEADISKADDIYTGSKSDGSVFMNTTRGIAAKEMGDERYYCAYAKLTDGTYAYSPLYQYSPQKYALSRIANSSNDKLKALCVSMLNYGAAAQNFFGYRTDDLMNASLTAQQQALVVSYDAGLFTGAVAADPAKTGSFVKTATGFTKKNASVSFEGAFAINYYFTPEFAVNGDVTLYVWDRETYEAAQTLTADNASSAVMTEQNGTWFASVSGIAPKDLDKTYYVAGVYTDESGNPCCTGVIAYSLSRYCMNNANNSMGALAQATAMYGYYANNYFA